MANLTSKAVRELAIACMFEREEDALARGKQVEGIMRTFVFDPDKLATRRAEICALLEELPTEFQATGGGGWSFLNACMDRRGNHWGEHPDVEMLMCLGLAVEAVNLMLPRAMWSAFPGKMPYFNVDTREEVTRG